jgi:hypothetical protein
MIRILLLGHCTGILAGNLPGNEYYHDRLVPDAGIDGSDVEHVRWNRCGNMTDKILR